MEQLVEQIIRKELALPQNETIQMERIFGGMSNNVYKVTQRGKHYIVRIPFEVSHHYVDYHLEKQVLDIVDGLGITNHILFFDIQSGVKISEYIEGEVLSQVSDFIPYLGKIAAKLHQLHDVKADIPLYHYQARLHRYETLLNSLDPQYIQLRDWWLHEYHITYQFDKKVFSHGDVQRSNIILSKEEIYFLDFEFSGFNTIYYDLASFGNIRFEDALLLCKQYFGDATTEEDLKRVRFYRMFQVLQWHLVAASKHDFGMGKTLNLAFDIISKKYLEQANMFYLELVK